MAPRSEVVVVRVGAEAKVGRNDLKIKVMAVEEDSRCPKDVQCVRAGNARVRLRARNSKGDRDVFALNTNDQPREIEFGRYRIELTDLRPYPTTAGGPSPRRYRAELTVTKLKR
jgi:hypothetical protein